MTIRDDTPFRLALDSEFRKANGAPAYPDFDMAMLCDDPMIVIEYVDFGREVSASITGRFDALVLLGSRFGKASAVPTRLRLVARFGVGYDTVDIGACTQAGIAVSNTPAGVRRPVAVAIMTLLLALSGRLLVKDRLARQGPAGYSQRNAHMGIGLMGRTLASVGLGSIGAEMFRMVRPLDMRLIAHDPFADAAVAAELGVELVDLDSVFRDGDFVTINCPLTPKTHHLVNADRLSLMRRDAFLINTARGPIVDQAALVAHLQTGRIAGAGLDVQEQEPLDADDPLLTLDSVILTPHALCWTDQCFAGIGASVVRSVLDVAQGRVPEGLVNHGVLDHPRWSARNSP